MRLLVRGGRVVTAAGVRDADVLAVDGVIDRVEPGIPQAAADEIVDAADRYVMPGFIDPHVHARDPGQTDKEDFAHLTRAAAAGGITTVLVMPNARPPVTDAASYERRAKEHELAARVDFGLWGLALGHETPSDLAEMREAGIVAAKLFWGYAFDRASGTLRYDTEAATGPDMIAPATNGDVWRLFRAAEQAGVIIGVHCEDHSLLSATAKAGLHATDPTRALAARPAEAEAISVATVVELARTSGARAHILHLSTARSVALVRAAQAEGDLVTAETCPHYLTLTPEDISAEPRRVKVFPPIRGGSEPDSLWVGVVEGTISSLGSDHAPHSAADREVPYERQPAGVAGTQTMVSVLLDAARQRNIPLELLAERLSEGTARLYGLHPQKGSLEPGGDADITIVDPERRWRIEPENLYSKDRRSPWQGSEGLGMPVAAFVRGRLVMRDGHPVDGSAGRLVRPGG